MACQSGHYRVINCKVEGCHNPRRAWSKGLNRFKYHCNEHQLEKKEKCREQNAKHWVRLKQEAQVVACSSKCLREAGQGGVETSEGGSWGIAMRLHCLGALAKDGRKKAKGTDPGAQWSKAGWGSSWAQKED